MSVHPSLKIALAPQTKQRYGFAFLGYIPIGPVMVSKKKYLRRKNFGSSGDILSL